MKTIRYTLFFFFSFSVLEVNSQSYIPMLTDSMYWDLSYSVVGMTCHEFGPNGNGPRRYYIAGDTMVNGTVYKKFRYYEFHRVSQMPGPNCPPFYLDTISFPETALMREDTAAQKVYLYDQGSQQDQLWYDFNLQIGDSIDYGVGWPAGATFYVDTIYYTTTPDGLNRKVIVCNDLVTLCGYYVEGIGGIAGPFHEPYYVFEEGWWLMCSGTNNLPGQYSLFDTAYYCTVLTTSLSQPESVSFTMTPNPTRDRVYVDAVRYPVELKVADVYGKSIKVYHLESSQTIDLSDLNPAVYFITVFWNENTSYTRKMLKL